jgi:SSS family transporter
VKLPALDVAIIGIYAVSIFALAQWVSREKGAHRKDAQDYFLAGRTLPWWAIGTSLIAANISAEQIIGMSGSGYVIGLGIASYEWMSALTLIIVGKYFLPIFLKNGIYTMPEFLERRYSPGVRTVMAIFWIGVYVFVNLTAILWLGATAVHTVTGVNVETALIGLGVFAGAYALYGGLKAVALTDIVQVSLLVLGGLVISYIALNRISGGAGLVAGFHQLTLRFPEKFVMILPSSSPNYKDLPGLSVLLGGMWVMNISYWGFNQYIIQRALAAKNVREAQKGIVLAAFLKLLMPVIIVLPGIAAAALAPNLTRADEAYPHLMAMLPSGLLGLVFAAPANLSATLGAVWSHHRRRRPGRRDLDGKTAAWQLRSSVPVHTGIHRLFHSRHLRHLPARHVLGALHGDRRAGGCNRLRGAVAHPEDGLACVAVHGPRRHGIPGVSWHRSGAVARADAPRSGTQGRIEGDRLLDERGLQLCGAGRNRYLDRNICHLVVTGKDQRGRTDSN